MAVDIKKTMLVPGTLLVPGTGTSTIPGTCSSFLILKSRYQVSVPGTVHTVPGTGTVPRLALVPVDLVPNIVLY